MQHFVELKPQERPGDVDIPGVERREEPIDQAVGSLSEPSQQQIGWKYVALTDKPSDIEVSRQEIWA
jgi:hypothetical protein